MTIIDKAVEWLRINKIGYFILYDKSGNPVGRAESDNTVKDFYDLTSTLCGGIYTIQGQKDKNNSASKVTYTFSIAEEKSHAVGNVDVNTSLLEQMHLQKLDFMKQFHELEMKQLKDKMKEPKEDKDSLSKISGIFADVAKIMDNNNTVKAVASVAPATVAGTTTNNETASDQVAKDLESIKDSLGGDEQFMKILARMAYKAKTDPANFKAMTAMI